MINKTIKTENGIKNNTKNEFLSEFFSNLASTAVDLCGLFTLDFYLHRGREYNLCYPDDHLRFKKGISNLKQRGYIKSKDNKSFKFTGKGRTWYQKNVFRATPFREKIWDKKWRVVFFDIPEEMHTKRDIFRYRLKNLGFYRLQKSIMTIPYKCEADIADISNRLGLNHYVDILVAESIGSKEEELKKVFNL